MKGPPTNMPFYPTIGLGISAEHPAESAKARLWMCCRETLLSAVAAVLLMLFVTRPSAVPWQVCLVLWFSIGMARLRWSHVTPSLSAEPLSEIESPEELRIEVPDLSEHEPEPVKAEPLPAAISPDLADALKANFNMVQAETDTSVEGIDRARTLLADAIGQLHSSFSGLQDRSRAQHEMMDELIGMIVSSGEGPGGESEDFVRATEELLDGFVDYILGTSKESMQIVLAINGAQSQLHEIRTVCQKSEKIASKTALLALNAKIQAAGAGEYGRTFTVVADEVRILADEAREFSQRIGQLVGTASETIDRMAKTVAALASRDMTDTISAKGRVDAMASSVASLNEKLEKTVAAAEQLSLDVTADVNLAVQSLQFEDIVTQALIHSAAAMRELSSFSEKLTGVSQTGGQTDLASELQDQVKAFRIQRQAASADPVRQSDMEAGDVELF